MRILAWSRTGARAVRLRPWKALNGTGRRSLPSSRSDAGTAAPAHAPVARGYTAIAVGAGESAVAGSEPLGFLALALFTNHFSSLLLPTVRNTSSRKRPLKFLPSRTTT